MSDSVTALLGEERALLREALAELVACKDLKEQIVSGYWLMSTRYEHDAAERAYSRRQPLAWEAARRALATTEASTSLEPESTAE